MSSLAEVHSQSGSAVKPSPTHSSSGSPCSTLRNHQLSTQVRCLSIPPRVIVVGGSGVASCTASSPSVCRRIVAR